MEKLRHFPAEIPVADAGTSWVNKHFRPVLTHAALIQISMGIRLNFNADRSQ
ncbi:hypothetical protein TcasGA2_TC006346 [Tribolium castaneum]|uniref:Uncharacterized protein n=1 Tax=Tribolium castaneum TaxID=7070 RepID=D6WW92_TRICA|nr:hypothetical protein TcasGA2_TC006346 [Tribolium castaneum]